MAVLVLAVTALSGSCFSPTSFFDKGLRRYHETFLLPQPACGSGDCLDLLAETTLPFENCGEPSTLARDIYARVWSHSQGIGAPGETLTPGEGHILMQALVPRLRDFVDWGFDMAPGGSGVNADGYCEGAGYQGPKIHDAILWTTLLRIRFGTGWNDPTLDQEYDQLVENPYQQGIFNSLYFNQFNTAATNYLLWGEERCDPGRWTAGFQTQNERFWRFREQGPREVYAIHYAHWHFSQQMTQTALREPSMQAQAEAAWDYQLALYMLTLGAEGMLAPLHVRNSSGALWQGKHLFNDLGPVLAMLGKRDLLGEDPLAWTVSYPFQAFTATSYRPAKAITALADTGEREVWWRIHNSAGSLLEHTHYDLTEGTASPYVVDRTVPQQCYVGPGAESMLCAQHQRSNEEGNEFGALLYAPLAEEQTLLAVHTQDQRQGDTDESGGTLYAMETNPETVFNSNYDTASFILPGDRGAAAVRLIDPRARLSRDDGVTPVARLSPRTRIMLPIHADSGVTLLRGAFTCDGGPNAGLACTPDATHQDVASCGALQSTCNNWRVIEVEDSFLGVRALGQVEDDRVVARRARFTLQRDFKNRECLDNGDPVGQACGNILDFYDKQVTAVGQPAGSFWWLAQRDDFASAASFLAFLEGLSHDFRDAEVYGHGSYPWAVLQARDTEGDTVHARLEYWSDALKNRPSRAACEMPNVASCNWSASEVDDQAEDLRYSLNQGLLQAWTIPARETLVDWDGEDGVLTIVDPAGPDIEHDWHDLWVDLTGEIGPAEPNVTVSASPHCP